MKTIRFGLLALVAGFVVACGGEVTDVSQGVESLNKEVLSQQNVELDCPDEVDGGEGATFDCTLKSTKNDKSAKVTLKIVKEDGDLAVDIADTKQFDEALAKVTA